MTVALGFDFDHTLAIDHALERDAFYKLAEVLGEPIPAEDVAYRAQIDTLLADFRAGTMPLDAAVKRFVASLHNEHVTDRDETDHFRRICYELVDTHVQPLAGLRELLAHLERAAIPHAILTNGWSPLQEKKAAAIGFRGPVLVSDLIGAAKPSARAFLRLAETFAVAPGDVWYVGDNPVADVNGALAAGLRAIWLDRGELAYPQSQPPPTLRITDLRELIERFPEGGPGPVGAVEKRA
jgi:HAD superfamily hydrolase (TIGR01549 family)